MIDEPLNYLVFLLVVLIVVAGVVAYFNTAGDQLMATVTGKPKQQESGPGLVFQSAPKSRTNRYPNRIGWPKEVSQVNLISSKGARNKYKMYYVEGTVRNVGNMLAKDTEAQATFFDAAGKKIKQSKVYVYPMNIPAGKTARFRISLIDRTVSARVASYKVEVLWTQIWQHSDR